MWGRVSMFLKKNFFFNSQFLPSKFDTISHHNMEIFIFANDALLNVGAYIDRCFFPNHV